MIRLQKDVGKWTAALTKPIVLSEGPVARLVTLRDAARLVSEHFDQQSGATQYAVELLLKAAETGESFDIELSTMQIERMLRIREWLK